MTETIKLYIDKIKSILHRYEKKPVHLVVGKYLYARAYVLDRWNDGYLYYFATSQTCIPVNPKAIILTPKEFTYKKLVETVQNFADYIVLERELYEKVVPFIDLPCRELIIVSEKLDEEIKNSLPFSHIHKIKVKERVFSL